MKRVLFFLVLLQGIALYAASPGQLAITLASEKSEYILGEPVIIRCQFQNLGDAPLVMACDLTFPDSPCAFHVSGPTRKECADRPSHYEIGAYVAPPPLLAHQAMTLAPVTASAYGAVDVGEYDFWTVYDSEQLGAAALRAMLSPLHAESNHLRIRITRPTGIDAEVFKKAANHCNQLGMTDEALLKDFSTSIYAGYALLSAGQCISDPRVYLTDLLGFDKHAQRGPQSADQMASDKKRSLEVDQKRADQLTCYLNTRPDFARADCLKVELAGRLAALQRYSESKALCDEIIANRPESDESKKARMLADFLTQKGYLKAAK